MLHNDFIPGSADHFKVFSRLRFVLWLVVGAFERLGVLFGVFRFYNVDAAPVNSTLFVGAIVVRTVVAAAQD